MADDIIIQNSVHILATDWTIHFVNNSVAAGDTLAHFLRVFGHTWVHDHNLVFTHEWNQLWAQHCHGGEVVVQHDSHARAAHFHHAYVLKVELVQVDSAFEQTVEAEVAGPDRFAVVRVEVFGWLLENWLWDVELSVYVHALGFKQFHPRHQHTAPVVKA